MNMNEYNKKHVPAWTLVEDLEEPVQAPSGTSEGPLVAIVVAVVVVVIGA
jgi:hypothetical protein